MNKRLKDFVNVRNETISPNFSGDILYVDISSVSQEKGIVKKTIMKSSEAPSRAKKVVRHNDVIISNVRTYLKSIALVEKPEGNLIVSTGFSVLKPKSHCNPLFLSYLLKNDFFHNQVMKKSKGVSYPAINTGDLLDIECSIDFKNQDKIVYFLDAACSKIDNEVALLKQKSILLDEYKNALIYETVTKGLDKNAKMKDSGVEWMGDVPSHWNIRRIKSFVKSLKTGKEDASHSDEDGVYDFYTCSVKNFKCNDFKFEGSAILLAGNGDISNIKHLKAKNSKFNAYQRVYILQKIKNNERYLYYSFKAGFVNSVRHKQKGSVIEFIKLQDITNFEILDFDINEQTKISNFLDIETAKIEKQIELINKKVELLKEYKQSLIYEAVTGQLEIE